MIPIRELLSRIRWDPQFGRGSFTIGYYDRIRKRVVRVPLTRIGFDPGGRTWIEAVEEDGSAHAVPHHRIREVYRDGKLIWQRPERRRA
jgi:uncharacterized protein (UPF0248 family)